MGKVKLNFDALYFVHGSPFVQSIGTAASHGCVRVRNDDAIKLARLVHQFGSPELAPEDVDRLALDTLTHDVALTAPVPVEMRYDLVEARDGRIYVYRDIYGLATRSLRDEIYAALGMRAIDTTRIDAIRVRALTRSVPRTGRSIAADSLMLRRNQ
jgi:murein L,D-transpeptidase YcbB/YkuD